MTDDDLDLMDDPGPAIQKAAEEHLAAVWEAFYAEEERDDGEQIDSPAVGPFCGCDTCITRETIAGAWPVIEKYFEQRQGRAGIGLPS